MRIAIVAFADTSAGDDAVGYEVLSTIDRAELPADIILIKGGTDAMRALETVIDMDALVIIDAATMGEAPGTVKTFSLTDVILKDDAAEVTLHGLRHSSDLMLAQKFLDIPPARIVCIEPERLTGSTVSLSLLSKMDDYVRAVDQAVRKLHREFVERQPRPDTRYL